MTKRIFRCEKDILLQQKLFQFNSNSIKKTLIIPQGAILLWSWRAHKKQHKVKRTLQHTTTNKRDFSKVVNIEQLRLHHKRIMKLRSH